MFLLMSACVCAHLSVSKITHVAVQKPQKRGKHAVLKILVLEVIFTFIVLSFTLPAPLLDLQFSKFPQHFHSVVR